MKYIGFISELNKMEISHPFQCYTEASQISPEVKHKVIDFLNQGVIVIAWMGYFEDVRTGKSISPFFYLTDGEWIWPSYFTYYLSEIPSFLIEQPFLEYLAAIDYNWREIEIEEQHFQSLKSDFLQLVMK